MNFLNRKVLVLILPFVLVCNLYSQDDRSFKIFHFPPNMILTIDAQTNDWDMVPEDYVIGIDQLWDDSKRLSSVDTTNLNVRVKVGWVKGLNILYFLYEAYDDNWDFSDPGLHNDTYELVVDGDQSGGPFIDRFHPNKTLDLMDAYLRPIFMAHDVTGLSIKDVQVGKNCNNKDLIVMTDVTGQSLDYNKKK